MKTRSLGILFITAVILPSILLAVLSIRSAGREEAYVEKELATTLLAEVTHVAGLANAEVARIGEELRVGLEVPAGIGYEGRLSTWKRSNQLVAVPFLLSPRYGILSPGSSAARSPEERKFIEENGDFLSDRAPTAVFENIAVRYKEQVLAEAELKKSGKGKADESAGVADAPGEDKAGGPGAEQNLDERAAPRSFASTATLSVPEAAGEKDSAAAGSLARREAIDTFAQSPEIQSKVYEQAREKGDVLNLRVVAPAAKAANAASSAQLAQSPLPAEPSKAVADLVPQTLDNEQAAPAAEGVVQSEARSTARDDRLAPTVVPEPPPAAAAAQQSQYVVTSQLLSQIAAQGEYGIIPRFIGTRLTFLFWEKQADGRIAGCSISSQPFHDRIAAVLPPTFTPARLLTILDETAAPIAVPPGAEGRSWSRPFVSLEIGEALPRWEAAAALTNPEAVAARARAASRTIWVLALILFVSVAGGGTMVLSSVYGELRLARRKTTFVTNVSHELKTPLTSISLFVEMLRQKRQPDPEKQQHYYSLMASETERLTRLINNVLDFSSIEKGKKTYATRLVSLADVATEMVESQRVRLESRGFTVLFSSPGPGEARVNADPEAMKQVILNLLSNAEKYSAEAKSIEVEVAEEQGGVAVHVRDRGIGVAEKDREKIFREFYRVDDSLTSRVQGTGLGLTIARRIARAHGGEVAHLPRDGGGSDFVLRLPEANT